MNRWTIGKRITLGFASVILISVVLGAFAYSRLINISTLSERMAHGTLPSVQSCVGLRINMKSNLGLVFQHVGSESKEEMAVMESQMRAATVQNNKFYEQLDKTITVPVTRQLLDKVVAARAVYMKQRDEILAISRQVTNNVAAYGRACAEVKPLADNYDEALSALSKTCRTDAELSTDGIQGNAASAEESAAAAEELNAQAEAMQGAVTELLALAGAHSQQRSQQAARKSKTSLPTSASASWSHPPAHTSKNGNGFRTTQHSMPKVATAGSSSRSEIPMEGDFKDF